MVVREVVSMVWSILHNVCHYRHAFCSQWACIYGLAIIICHGYVDEVKIFVSDVLQQLKTLG